MILEQLLPLEASSLELARNSDAEAIEAQRREAYLLTYRVSVLFCLTPYTGMIFRSACRKSYVRWAPALAVCCVM
jgi:hypothetical protein